MLSQASYLTFIHILALPERSQHLDTSVSGLQWPYTPIRAKTSVFHTGDVCVCVCVCVCANGACFTLEVTGYFIHQLSEADWLTRARDRRCAEASKIRPSSVSVRCGLSTWPGRLPCPLLCPHWLLATQTFVQWAQGVRTWPPLSVQARNACICTSFPSYVVMTWRSIKQGQTSFSCSRRGAVNPRPAYLFITCCVGQYDGTWFAWFRKRVLLKWSVLDSKCRCSAYLRTSNPSVRLLVVGKTWRVANESQQDELNVILKK
jgi:hypothetical protein